ncbi:glucose-1-phosphate adenylyltransferase [[Mycoplasma] testudinis]|uniref:glucose-1-phosphate adenylyltransferase n=1 Tax=[Mycoplasma] testudinis TaxID=33924 RepID=UPI00056881D3|nr:glucose-1-phosphate adenylyltransferase [[Mycoplasma] testudinis]
MKKEVIALILAGGQGSRLKQLTAKIAKPAVPFGGRYRIIDFALSNCTNSGIDTVGVLTQYQPLALARHIGIGLPWDLDRSDGGVTVLSPQVRGKIGSWYEGTSHAVFENFEYIEEYNPDYLVVLSGDHIYKMDYSKLIEYHKEHEADVTIAAMEVPWEDASRFGILNVDKQKKIVEFDEKPAKPKNNLASMGIYVFNWNLLKRTMEYCNSKKIPFNDFGHDLLPYMLEKQKNKIYAYLFKGYWKDVGTVNSYWEANLDLIHFHNELDLSDRSWIIYSKASSLPPQFLGSGSKVKQSFVGNGCHIDGTVENSMIFQGVDIEAGAVVKDSVIMSDVKISKGASVIRSVVIEKQVVPVNAKVGSADSKDIYVYAGGEK